MKLRSSLLFTGLLCLTLSSVQAQPGGRGGRGMGGPAGPGFSGAMAKLFGDNSGFSSDLEIQGKGHGDAAGMTMEGKIAVDQGKSRFEMDMSSMKGGKMPPAAAAQMKAMGMDKMVMISIPEKNLIYMIYPKMEAYVENPAKDTEGKYSPDDYKITLTELGKETVDGHPCIKNKAVVTDKEGKSHESTIWSATDLKNFPVKIETKAEENGAATMLFKNIVLSKPDSSKFEAPAGFKKYDSMQEMMMQVMMKKRGNPADQ